MKKALISSVIALAATASCLIAESPKDKDKPEFRPKTLVVGRSVYVGTAGTVTIGQTLPPGCVANTVTLPVIGGGTTTVKVKCATAVDNGEYPNLNDNHNVWNNDGPDSSFGVTSPIFLDDITTRGRLIGTLPIPTDMLVTSFSSKSELAVNRSTDGKSITFVGYHGGPGFGRGPNPFGVSKCHTHRGGH